MTSPRPSRPVLLGPRAFASRADDGTQDAAARVEAAHSSAAALVEQGRASADPAVRERLLRLVEDHGLETVAQLWAERPARSLPGALWRLYALAEAVRVDGEGWARDFRAGDRAEVARAVAGALEPPAPDDLRRLVAQVLHGVFGGDLGVALERAAAFCRVVVAGRTADPDGPADRADTERAADLLTTAQDLEAVAAAWRAGTLG